MSRTHNADKHLGKVTIHRNEIDEATDCLRSFFSDRHAGLFVLKGKYGSGKSYFLREQILEQKEFREKFSFLSYTSVFGVNDIKSLNEVAVGSTEPGSLKLKAKWIEKGVTALFGILGNWVPFLKGINVSATSAIWAIARRAGLLLVIDDVDRKGKGLSLEELIGFANSLVEHSQANVRAIIVVNEDELGEEKEMWDKLREKFIDAEFAFNPSPTELANHFVKSELSKVIGEIHSAFKSPNIRTMLKIESKVLALVDRFERVGISLSPDEKESAIKLAALFYRAGNGYSVEDLETNTNSLCSLFFDRTNGNDPNSPSNLIAKDVMLIQFSSQELLNQLFLTFYRDSSMNESELLSLKETRLKQAKSSEYAQKSRQFWGLVHRSLKDNQQEFIKAGTEHFHEFPTMTVKEVSELTDAVTRFGGDTTEIWKIWLKKNLHTVDKIYFGELRERVPDALSSMIPEVEEESPKVEVKPEKLFEAIEDNKGLLSEEERSELTSWTTKDWLHWLNTTDYEYALYSLKNFIRADWRNLPEFQKMRSKLMDALRSWANQSEINRFRAEGYFPECLEVPEDEQTGPQELG
ncbi:hypothetical protein VSU19_10205 [Verrucomicrobiales bacterium BCK34]|nr:hypothetical protein [Verrucomicrobiales bacterium BCK34]